MEVDPIDTTSDLWEQARERDMEPPLVLSVSPPHSLIVRIEETEDGELIGVPMVELGEEGMLKVNIHDQTGMTGTLLIDTTQGSLPTDSILAHKAPP